MPPPLSMNGALAQLLADFRGQEVVSLLNRGNRGHGVTHLGGRRFLSDLGLVHRELRETDDLRAIGGDVLLLHGAATLSRGARTLPRLMRTLAPRFQHIVLLPASFDLTQPRVRDFAETWDKKFHVFCRELVSFTALREFGATPHRLLLGHDLAFHADLAPWAARPASGRAGLFRRDNEAAYGRLPRNFDASDDASLGSDREPERLLEYVARFAEIHTDRCHAAIAAAMMGRRVVFYRNNYFKNQAIYDHSLSPLPNVRFVQRTPFSVRQFSRAVYWGRVRPAVHGLFGGRSASAT